MANEPINAAMYRYHMQRIAKAESPKTIVEVGVYCGDLSRSLLAIKSVKRMWLVDPWKGVPGWHGQEHMDHIADSVLAWSKVDPRVTVLRLPSVEAAPHVADRSTEFWHLDGEHLYVDVIADLKAWFPKMKPGSLMTGDNFEIPDVARAVKEFFGQNRKILSAEKINVTLEGKGRIWLARV